MKQMMKKVMGVASGLVVGALVVGVINSNKVVTVQANTDTPQEIISDYLTQVQLGQFDEIFTNAQIATGQVNDQTTYINKVQEVLGNVTDVQYKTIRDEESDKEFALYVDNEKIASVEQAITYDGTYRTFVHFNDEVDYLLQVATGSTVTVNGVTLSEGYQREKGVTATNFTSLYDESQAPKVDVYYLPDMIAIPEIEIDGVRAAVIKDVTEDILYAGEDLTLDDSLINTIISYAEICSGFPAQDTSLGSVANISVTNGAWYSKVSEVQNQWFTAHGTRSYSNEDVQQIVRQADDAVIANVSFDYYASNGSVDRTWNCGYQMTLFNIGGVWKVAQITIDGTLNPARTNFELY